jgi:hypothetical protein
MNAHGPAHARRATHAGVVRALLGKGSRAAMMAWLAGALDGNGERAKMQVNFNVSEKGWW